MTKQERNTLKELTLLTLYLGGWEEDSRKEPGKKAFRAWKGFLFEILNELERDGSIQGFIKSVVFTEEGRAESEKLKRNYLAQRKGTWITKKATGSEIPEMVPSPTEGKHALVYRGEELMGAGTLRKNNGKWHITYEKDNLPYDGKIEYRNGELVFNAPDLVLEGEEL